MKTLVFLVYLLFFSFSVFAQNSGFKVLLTEGTHTFGENQFITIGSEIPENQTIKFEGEYLAMMDSEGKTIELTEKGVYSMKDLKAKMKFQPNGLWRKYLFYLTSKPFLEGKLGQKRRFFGSHSPKIFFSTDHRSAVYASEFYLTWFVNPWFDRSKEVKKISISILNFEDTVLSKNITFQQAIFINWQNEKLRLEKTLLIKAMAFDSLDRILIKDEFTAIEKLDSADYQAITEEMFQIQNTETPILSQLVLANFFEEKELIIDAQIAYLKLLEMNNLALFRVLYQNFLYRNGLIKEAFFKND